MVPLAWLDDVRRLQEEFADSDPGYRCRSEVQEAGFVNPQSVFTVREPFLTIERVAFPEQSLKATPCKDVGFEPATHCQIVIGVQRRAVRNIDEVVSIEVQHLARGHARLPGAASAVNRPDLGG